MKEQFKYSVVDPSSFKRELEERNINYNFIKSSPDSDYSGTFTFIIEADDLKTEMGRDGIVEAKSLGFYGNDAYSWQDRYFSFTKNWNSRPERYKAIK